jgi:hypothetical protein
VQGRHANLDGVDDRPAHDEAGWLLGIAAYLRDATARFEEMCTLRRELAELKAA